MAAMPLRSSEKAWAEDQRSTSRERGRAGKTFSYTLARMARISSMTLAGAILPKRYTKAASETPTQGIREAAKTAMGNRDRNE